MKAKQLELEIYGRVQGIRLRNIIKKFANKNSIFGFVKNKKDGTVLIIAQGNKAKLNSLVKWLKSNPGLAKIQDLKIQLNHPKKEYSDFKIIKDKNFFLDQLSNFFNLFRYTFKIPAKINKIPIHIAIIPDGNRRWAKSHGLSAIAGHYTSGSYKNMKSLFEEAKDLGVKYMSIWGFSTENWSRDKKEQKAIFDLIRKSVNQFRKDAQKEKIRFRHLGRKDRLPKNLVKKLIQLERETISFTDFNVQICLDYGGRDEILRAINKILKSKSKPKTITENKFKQYLDTKDIPDPDLIIRTSGEQRTSGLLPFQAPYAELYFTPIHFPEFSPKELRKAIEEYAKRQRRFGGS